MSYESISLKERIKIRRLYTIHYFEYSKYYDYAGEYHDFWEFVYVDRGEIDVTSDDKLFRLKQGEIIFHKPNEFHNLAANGIVAPNLIVISFECKSRAMRYFNNKILSLAAEEKKLLTNIVNEGIKAFSSPMDDANLTKLERYYEQPFGCEQLIKLYLEEFLIKLYRNNAMIDNHSKSLSVLSERSAVSNLELILDFLNDNIAKNLTFEDVQSFSKLSAGSLKRLFRQEMGLGVITYFRRLKIERAKVFIREDNYNFTQIAALLGYDSIHYFSRQFKAIAGMSPREYAKSVKLHLTR